MTEEKLARAATPSEGARDALKEPRDLSWLPEIRDAAKGLLGPPEDKGYHFTAGAIMDVFHALDEASAEVERLRAKLEEISATRPTLDGPPAVLLLAHVNFLADVALGRLPAKTKEQTGEKKS